MWKPENQNCHKRNCFDSFRKFRICHYIRLLKCLKFQSVSIIFFIVTTLRHTNFDKVFLLASTYQTWPIKSIIPMNNYQLINETSSAFVEITRLLTDLYRCVVNMLQHFFKFISNHCVYLIYQFFFCLCVIIICCFHIKIISSYFVLKIDY